MPKPVSVLSLREKLVGLPDDASVVLFDARTNVIAHVIDHFTVDKSRNMIALHLDIAPADEAIHA